MPPQKLRYSSCGRYRRRCGTPIDLTKFLRHPRRIAADQYLANLVRELFNLPKLCFAIQWYGNMKAFGP
jgi:hypothetical protein